jgi:hypothetical protein
MYNIQVNVKNLKYFIKQKKYNVFLEFRYDKTKNSEKANTLSHNAMWHWFYKFCVLARKIIKKESTTRMIGGLGAFCQN